ncbi:hypothetical protein BH23GEM6_BH23GEM6_01120 [soil metagenome]
MEDTRDVVITQSAEDQERRRREGGGEAPSVGVRDADLEPHEGLRYIARLFKILAVLLIVMLLFEVFIGLTQQGAQAIPTLIVEMTRLIVFAAFLWGAGDLALMLIESNHDLRATRILMGRLNGKVQRMVDLEADELELLAANPGMLRQRRAESRADERDRKRMGGTAGDSPPAGGD